MIPALPLDDRRSPQTQTPATTFENLTRFESHRVLRGSLAASQGGFEGLLGEPSCPQRGGERVQRSPEPLHSLVGSANALAGSDARIAFLQTDIHLVRSRGPEDRRDTTDDDEEPQKE